MSRVVAGVVGRGRSGCKCIMDTTGAVTSLPCDEGNVLERTDREFRLEGEGNTTYPIPVPQRTAERRREGLNFSSET